MGLTSCRWITIAKTIARRRRVAQPASCRLPCRCRTLHPHLWWAGQECRWGQCRAPVPVPVPV